LTLEGWLDELASGEPTPGGGAAAALNAAIGAALVSMVCRLTIGKPRYAEHEPTMTGVLVEADRLRAEALALAAADAEAFGAVSRAYQLPRATDDERTRRGDAIQAALADAAAVPLRVVAVAGEIVALAERALPGANVNVISDLAVAAASAWAAGESAAVNVEVNVAALRDESRRTALAGALDALRPALARAESTVAAVRERIRP
jgi:formiminotetrahydrofolate cyclodeaminase